MSNSSNQLLPATEELMKGTWVFRQEFDMLMEDKSLYSFVRSLNAKGSLAIRFSHDAPFLSPNQFIYFGLSNGSIENFKIDENGILVVERPKDFAQKYGNTELYFKNEGKDTVLYFRAGRIDPGLPYSKMQESLESVLLSKLVAGKYWIDAKPVNQVIIKPDGSISGLEDYKSLSIVFPYKDSPQPLDLFRIYKNNSESDWYGWRIVGQALHLYSLGKVTESEKIPEMKFDLNSLAPKYKLFIALL